MKIVEPILCTLLYSQIDCAKNSYVWIGLKVSTVYFVSTSIIPNLNIMKFVQANFVK